MAGTDWNAILHDAHPRVRKPELRIEVMLRIARHRDGGRAGTECPAQEHLAAPLRGDVLGAVHRDDVWDANPPRRGRAVDRHRELVTEHEIDAVVAQHVYHVAKAAPIERLAERERLRVEAGVAKLAGQPAAAHRWADGHDRVSSIAHRARQAQLDQLGPAGAVRLEHLGDNHVRTRFLIAWRPPRTGAGNSDTARMPQARGCVHTWAAARRAPRVSRSERRA